MCLTEEKREEHEQFVQSAVKKQQRNKRKREPNMYVAAVLECTVRRICSEVCSSYFCLCSHSKRRKLSTFEEPIITGKASEKIESANDKEDVVNKVQAINFKSSGDGNAFSEVHGTCVIPQTPQRVPSNETEAEDFLNNLSLELTELPSFEEVDGLLKEIEYGLDLDVLEEEIGTLMSTDDPFHPGLLEGLFYL